MNLRERVGTDQRIAVLDLLSRALVDGYLDLPEYDRRSVVAYSAVTVGDLVAQLADLPRQFHWFPVAPLVARPAPVERGAMAGVALSLGVAAIPTAFCVGFGGLLGIAAVLLGGLATRDRRQYAMGVSAMVLGSLGIGLALFTLAIIVMA